MSPKKLKVTRSAASQKQRQVIDSLASITSPPKASTSKTKKSPKKQASLELSEVKGIIAQVVTETKQGRSDDENSTGSENVLFVPQVKMAPSLDRKLEHLLTADKLLHGNR